eukprot:scpid74565/ scgid27629/ 
MFNVRQLFPVLTAIAMMMIPASQALHVVAPPTLARFVPAPFFNFGIGVQNEDVNITGRAMVIPGFSCTFQGNVSGLIAIVDVRHGLYTMQEERDLAKCLENKGAIAIIRTASPLVPGFNYHWNQGHNNGVDIPLVACYDADLMDVVAAIKADVDMNVTIQVDMTEKNRWQEEMWDTQCFFLLHRVIIPGINACAVVIILVALVKFYLNYQVQHKINKTQQVMIIGLLTEFVGAALRIAYGITGPHFSTHKVHFFTHLFLINFSTPFTFISDLVATDLFMRWGAFGEMDGLLKKVEIVFVGMSGSFIVTQLFLSYVQSGYVQGISSFVVVYFNISTLIVFASFASWMFLHYGFRFLKQLKFSADTKSHNRNRAMQKAVKWVMISAFGHGLIIIAVCLAAWNNFFYTPQGWNITYFLLYLGLSLSSFAQAIAFKPIVAQSGAETFSQSAKRLTFKLSELPVSARMMWKTQTRNSSSMASSKTSKTSKNNSQTFSRKALSPPHVQSNGSIDGNAMPRAIFGSRASSNSNSNSTHQTPMVFRQRQMG